MDGDYKLRPHHVANLIHYHFNGFDDFRKIHKGYSNPFSEHIFQVYSELISDSSLHVEIVDGKDSICLASPSVLCSRETKSCSHPSIKDRVCGEGYDLSEGDIYSVGDLLKMGDKFKSKTGYETPLHQLIAHNTK